MATVGLVAGCSAAAPAGAPSPSTQGPASTSEQPAPAAPAGTVTVDASTTVLAPSLATPAGVADAITTAEQGIRSNGSPAEIERWGRLQQRAYRALAGHPEWDEQVRAVLPAGVLAAFDLNVAARRAVVAHAAARPASEPPAELPAWTIAAPLGVDVLLGYYHEAETLTGVPWAYLAAIHLMETRMGRVVGVSDAGAVGPMQFLPATWAECCTGDPLDARDAIIGAATYLRTLGAPGDVHRALLGYNPNDGYVGAVEAYAQNMLVDPSAYLGYHAWEVYVSTSAGTVRLPVGYTAAAPIDAATYLAGHPADRAPVDD